MKQIQWGLTYPEIMCSRCWFLQPTEENEMLEAIVGSEFTLTAYWFLVYYLNGTDHELGDSRLLYAIFFYVH